MFKSKPMPRVMGWQRADATACDEVCEEKAASALDGVESPADDVSPQCSDSSFKEHVTLPVDDELRRCLPRNEGYSASFIAATLQSNNVDPPQILLQAANAGKSVRYAAAGFAQDQRSRLSLLLGGRSRGAAGADAGTTMGRLQLAADVCCAAAVAAKARAAIAEQLGVSGDAASAVQAAAAEAVARANTACAEAAAAAAVLRKQEHQATETRLSADCLQAERAKLENVSALHRERQAQVLKPAAAASPSARQPWWAAWWPGNSSSSRSCTVVSAVNPSNIGAAGSSSAAAVAANCSSSAREAAASEAERGMREFHLILAQAAAARAQRQRDMAKLLIAPELRAVLATMAWQRNTQPQQPQVFGSEKQEWAALWANENPVRRLLTLRYMLRHQVAPFNLCCFDLSSGEQLRALLRGLPWLCKSRAKLTRWELRHLPELRLLEQLSMQPAGAQAGRTQPTALTVHQSPHAARRLCFDAAVRYTLAPSVRYLELQSKALCGQLQSP